MFGAGDEVVEGGLFVGEFAGLIPAASEFAAAADLGDGEADAAVEEAEEVAVEPRIVGAAVGAVAVDEDGTGAVGGMVFGEEQPDGDEGSVFGGGVGLFDAIFARIVAGRAGFLFDGFDVAGGEVEFGDGVGLEEGFVADALESGLEVGCVFGAEPGAGAGGGEPAGLRGIGGVEDVETGDAVFAGFEDDVVGEGFDGAVGDGFVAGEDFGPVGAGGLVEGGAEDAAVDGVFAAEDEPVLVGVGEGVTDAGSAWGDEDGFGVGLVEGDERGFHGVLAAGGEAHEAFAFGGTDGDLKGGVVVFVDDGVVGGVGPEGVAFDAAGAFGGVGFGVEEGLIVEGPDRGLGEGGVGDLVGEDFAGGQVLDVDGVAVGAVGVFFPGIEVAVGGNGGSAEGVAVAGSGAFVEVEEDGFGSFGIGFAAEEAVVFAFDVAAVVEPVAFAVRDGDVFADNAGFEFSDDFSAQRIEGGEDGIGVLVFGLEVGQDGGVFAVAQPVVVVGPVDAVSAQGVGAFFGDGGWG